MVATLMSVATTAHTALAASPMPATATVRPAAARAVAAAPVRYWRTRVAARRALTVHHAYRVGIALHAVALERRTLNVGYLRWLVRAWAIKDRPYRSQLRRYLPALLCIHSIEGAWDAYNPAGYYGGLQMDMGFQQAYGSDKLRKYRGRDARYWTPTDQLAVAMRAVRTRGFTPWSNSASACGLL